MNTRKDFISHLQSEIDGIQAAGLHKGERLITSKQDAHVNVPGRDEVINLCANNYLGLAGHPTLLKTAKEALDRWGYGMASVRFICGTQSIHRELEKKLAVFLGTEDTILYSSCFDAAGGLFEVLLGPEDAVLSDQLNHACIIDGIRLCKAQRFRYANNDMADLEAKLKEAGNARFKLIVTDGVFSMDGYIANLPAICDLADKYEALVMVDDSHSVGFMGTHGRGTHEHHDVMGRIDIITGTLGKALGGASGGYTSGHKEIIDLLRQRSRPYLFSNTLAPVITATSIKVLDLLEESGELRDQLRTNTEFFRQAMDEAGFRLLPGEHPIIPVMFGDAHAASAMAEGLLDRGVYVVAFSYPVVPKNEARIRVQMSAAHSREDLKVAIKQFQAVRDQLGLKA